jgi:hypothetical protein
MSVPCKFERSLLSHEEYDTVHVTHHPAIQGLDRDGLHQVKGRLQDLRDKERTLARQKRREVRGKADPRGGSFPGTAERPLRRKQVFSGALKRVNKEIGRLDNLEARAVLTGAARKALALRRAGETPRHPSAEASPGHGMHPTPNQRGRTEVRLGTVGSVSQATRVAQAARDSKTSS